jgi:Tfp pilus assembly protein PilO
VRFNKIKQTYLIGGVAILLLALLSWFFLLAPRIAQASEIGEHTAMVESQNVTSAAQIVTLTGLKDGLVHERAVAAALAVKFPPTADEATLLRQILAAAKTAGIPEKSITSLGPAAPILGAPSSGAKLPGAGAVPASGEAAPAKGAGPAKGAENMAVMAVAFNAQGDFTQMVAMLKNLEDLPRSFLITQVNLSSADKGKFTIAVQGNMYVHRAVSDPEAAVAPAVVKPAPTPTQGGTIVKIPGGTASLAPGVTIVTPTATP